MEDDDRSSIPEQNPAPALPRTVFPTRMSLEDWFLLHLPIPLVPASNERNETNERQARLVPPVPFLFLESVGDWGETGRLRPAGVVMPLDATGIGGNRAANGCVWFCHDGERHGLELEDVARGESVVWEVLGMEEERRGDEAMTGMEYEEVRASE